LRTLATFREAFGLACLTTQLGLNLVEVRRAKSRSSRYKSKVNVLSVTSSYSVTSKSIVSTSIVSKSIVSSWSNLVQVSESVSICCILKLCGRNYIQTNEYSA